jgi:hypothetical protein
MTTREKGYVYYAECCESLSRALRILRGLRGTDATSAVRDAAYHFAVAEYAKPYCLLGDARMRNRRAYRLGPPDLSPEDLALHWRIIALRDQLLAHQELALHEAMELSGGHEAQASVDIAKNGPPPLVDIEAMVGLIERTLVIMYKERSRLLASLGAAQSRRRLVAKAVKVAIQGMGMLAGVFGLGVLGLLGMMGFGAHHAIVGREPLMVMLSFLSLLFGVLFGVYMIYVAYLATFKYSPLAVRHVCGALAFIALGPLTHPLIQSHTDSHRTGPHWKEFAFLICLVVLYYAYRAASNRLNGFLFPEVQPMKCVPQLRETRCVPE